MTRRAFVIACSIFVLAAPLAAQSGGEADLISGKWTGELVMPGAPAPLPVMLQLKFDGKGAVSGTFSGLPNPGDVKKGTFDPKTGALKLEVGPIDEDAVLLVLEGTVVKGVATGKLSGRRSGTFKIARES